MNLIINKQFKTNLDEKSNELDCIGLLHLF